MGAHEKRGWSAPPGTVVARRAFLTGAMGLVGLAISSHPVFAAVANLAERRITLKRAQFGESFSGIYWQDGQYVPEALSEVSRLFREPKNGAVKEIDPRLLDGLLALQRRMDSAESFDVVSGFRQPQATENAADARKTSYHYIGRAADVRLSGRTTQQIFDAARALQIGGVGRYAGKELVHVDTGEIRTWAWGYGNRNVTMGSGPTASGPAVAQPAAPTKVAMAQTPAPLVKPAAGAPLKAAPPAPLPRPR